MPRKPSTVPVARRHQNGQAYVSISGQRVYLGPFGQTATNRAYSRLIEAWEDNGRLPLDRTEIRQIVRGQEQSEIVRVTDVAEHYQHDRRHTHPTHQNTIGHAMNALVRDYGDIPAEKFTPAMLKEVRQRLIDGRFARGARTLDPAAQKTSPMSRKEINRRVRIMQNAFRLAVEDGMITDGPAIRLGSVRELRYGEGGSESEPVGPLDERTIELTVEHAGRTVGDMIRVQMLTGMRPAEVCRLSWGEIERRDDGPWVYRPSEHKTKHRGKERRIFIGPRAQAILMRYADRPSDAPMFCPRQASSETPNGRPDKVKARAFTTMSYGAAVRRAAKRAGVEPWGVNRLRHNGADRFAHEFGQEVAQTALGHTSIRTTGIYTTTNVQALSKAVMSIG